ncbi:hypothetical protein [Flavobacterium sp.]|uniref:hypothetical protein n=1 Tax=Flavobacterium sp. TaxID=239 RepID=UPI00333F7165
MNSLNPIYKINKLIYVINLLLYLAVSPGMAFQIILGITQFISAIYLTKNFYKKVSNFTRKLLKTYWTLTIIVFISMVFIGDIFSIVGIIICFLLPMLTATFFMYLFYKCRKEING